jgi:polar amino acid transport system permease protein
MNIATAIANWFRHLNEVTGFNFTMFYEPYDFWRFVGGLKMTLYLAIASILLSLIIGASGAALQNSPNKFIRRFVDVFVVIFRNTPPLVQILFFYFGVNTLLPSHFNSIGLREQFLTNVQWAILSLSLFGGAFNIEIFRSGIEAVPRTTAEAALALGYSRLGAYWRVILPLALRVCLPALNNNLVNLFKTTTLAYAIAVPELLYVSSQLWQENQAVAETMIVLLVTYLLLVSIVVWIMNSWERALKIPGYGR